MMNLILEDRKGNVIAAFKQKNLTIKGSGSEMRIEIEEPKAKMLPVEGMVFVTRENKEIIAKSLNKLLMDKSVDLIELEISNGIRSIPDPENPHWMKSEYDGESSYYLRILNRKCQRKKRK